MERLVNVEYNLHPRLTILQKKLKKEQSEGGKISFAVGAKDLNFASAVSESDQMRSDHCGSIERRPRLEILDVSSLYHLAGSDTFPIPNLV